MDQVKKISRKNFIKYGFAKAVVSGVDALRGITTLDSLLSPSVSGSKTKTTAWVRPPGAVKEEVFLSKCTRCDECIKACVHLVIRKAAPELGTRLEGTPIIIPDENPCLMCSDFPCIKSCESQTLYLPDEVKMVRIGHAAVVEERCYMAQNQPCDYCVVHCPENPKAISAVSSGKSAGVSVEHCTGCGKCAQICPANAIAIRDQRMFD